MGFSRTGLFLIFRAAFCLLIAGTSAFAQSTRPPSGVDRRIETINRQAKEFERDNMTRDAKVKADPETAKRSRQIRMEIEEDLNFLQTTYNNVVMALQGPEGLRSGFAAETGRAVRKHAIRLKSNLALPESDGKDEKTGPPPLPDTDRKTLTALCRVIYDLVVNPMFDGTSGFDLKNGVKARLDLDAIVRLSEHLSFVPEIADQ